MGFFDSFTGSAQAQTAENGTREADRLLTYGRDQARGNINQGYRAGNSTLTGARDVATSQNALATGALDQGRDAALGYLNPYIEGGGRANTFYENALGINGLEAQREFGNNYAASDPFREQNARFASEDLMRALNARGLSGSGFAGAAIGEQSLRRGSQDYGNYLNRLQGQAGQGMQAAGQAANVQSNWGNARANQAGNYASQYGDLSGRIATGHQDRGNALGTLNYGYAQQRAGNQIGLANAKAQAQTAGINNLFSLGGLAVKAYGGRPGTGTR